MAALAIPLTQLHSSALGQVLSVTRQPGRPAAQVNVLPSGTARVITPLTPSADDRALIDELTANAPWLGIRALDIDLDSAANPDRFTSAGFVQTDVWVEWRSPSPAPAWSPAPHITFERITAGRRSAFDALFFESYQTTSREMTAIEDDLAELHLCAAAAPEQYFAAIIKAVGEPIGVVMLSLGGELGEFTHIGLRPGRRTRVRSVTETVLATLIDSGCREISTLVSPDNAASARLNRFFGFEPVGSRVTFRKVLGSRFDGARHDAG